MLTCLLLLAATVRAESESISKQKAAAIAQSEHPGRVLSIKRKATSYRVKILSTDGELRIIRIDARDGKIITD